MDTQIDSIRLETRGGTIYAADWAAIATLYAKIAAAQAAAAAVKRDGRHGQGYTYTTWAETVAVVGTALTTAKLSFSVNLVDVQTTDKVTTVHIACTLGDTQTGAMLVTSWSAQGQDITKATTSATKHWWLKTLLLTDHEDAPAAQPRPAQPAAPRRVDATTGEILPVTPPPAQPAAPAAAQPALTIPAPPAAASMAAKWSWFEQARKAARWSSGDLHAWLSKHYDVHRPPDLNGRTDEAMTAFYAALSAPAEIPM